MHLGTGECRVTPSLKRGKDADKDKEAEPPLPEPASHLRARCSLLLKLVQSRFFK